MDERLVDRIYEAGAVPELWVDVLSDLGRLAGGLGAVLFVPGPPRWIATPAIEEMFTAFVTSGLISTNERTKRLVALNHPGFVTDQDVFRLEDIADTPIHRDFFIPRGGGFGVATVIPAPSGDIMILHVERAFADGPVETDAVRALDALRPHLARASLLSARMELQRASAAAAALATLGLPGAVLGRLGRLMATNQLFDALIPHVVQDRQPRLALADRNADPLFADALASLDGSGSDQRVKSIPVAALNDQPAIIVHVIPIRGVAHDIFASASAIVVVTPVVPRDVPSAEVVQGLFDLTPAEARLAREIGRGKTVAEIAAVSGLSPGTLRTQIKAILGKTGLHRQADLLGLLRGVSAVMPPESDA